MNPKLYEDWKKSLEGHRLPAAVLDLDAFDRNVKALAGWAAASTIRPKTIRIATKSVRTPDLLRRVLDSSPVFRGLMCYSAEEALWLSSLGFDDFLVAYPTYQDAALEAFFELRQKGKTVYAMTDSLDTVDRIAKGLSGCANPLPVLIDYDASLRLFGGRLHLGVRRSPIRSPLQAIAVIEEILRQPELEFAGVMSYEAQVAGLTDRNPFHRFLNPFAGWIRRASATSIAERREELAAVLSAQKLPFQIFNGGGTGSLDTTSYEDILTEVTAGSALFAPHLFDYYSNIQFEPSLMFALQVVRSSDPGYVTCQGGGYIASGTPGWERRV